MKNFLVLAITLLALQLEAQVKHDYVWLFGYEPDDPHPKIGGSKLDFNIYPYDTSRFDIPFRFKAISMISDSGGALQFYTNGCQIANAAHQIMANGDDLNPGLEHEVYCAFGYPLEQGVLTLPWPGNKNRYVIIHMQFEGEDGEFNLLYSVIKMDTMNNLGAVTIKNQSLLFNEKVCDILTAVKHANGRDWWIVLPKTRSNLFLTWLLTPEGFTGPYEQPHGDDWDYRYYLNHGVFSPDGTTYVRASPSNGLRISRFDRCTGYFTLPLNIPFEIEASVSGVAISPNSRLLYLSTGFHLWQYDLYAADIGSSATLIDIFDGYQSPFNTTFYQPMLAPDGKIYMTCTNGNDVLHIIHRPDERGADCRFEQHGLRIPTYHAFMAPNFPHYRLGPLDGSVCDTLGINNMPLAHFRWDVEDTLTPLQITFSDLSSYEPATWFWDFGDGTISQDTSPVHLFPAPGTYTICLRVCNDYACDTLCREVTVGASGTTETAADPAGYQIYPNPTATSFTLQKTSGFFTGSEPVVMYNSTGQVLATRQPARGETSLVFGVESYPPGVYWLRVEGVVIKVLRY